MAAAKSAARASSPTFYEVPASILTLIEQVAGQTPLVQQRLLGWIEGKGLGEGKFTLKITHARVSPAAEEASQS